MKLNLRERMRTDPVRDILGSLKSWWGEVGGWRKLFIGGLIIGLSTILLLIFLSTLMIYVVRGLTSGGMRNRDLYLPRVRL